MRTLTALLLTLFVSVWALCGEANTTIVVKQLTEAQRDELPENTLQLKLQCYTLAQTPLATELRVLMDEVCDQDLGHTAFVLKSYTDSAGRTAVDVAGLDELGNIITAKRVWGAVMHNDHCFVLIDKSETSPFVKAKGKHTLVQEYEFVEEVIAFGQTHVRATWADGKLNKHLFIMNGENRVQENPSNESGCCSNHEGCTMPECQTTTGNHEQ
ncbi:MAG: hypothetical protein IJT30_02185 [Muribaculaceae bacterium]|nr:hypothetical protein [Muribaculaceae bacterium]